MILHKLTNIIFFIKGLIVKENIQVLIYSSSLCGYCYQAKSLLKKKNIPFQEIDIDEDFNKRKEMIAKSNGKTSVPQIFLATFILEDAMIYSILKKYVN